MQKIAKFEKVSYEEFYTAMKSDPHSAVKTDRVIESIYRELELPIRSTKGSAGYDFHSPFQFWLRPGETIKIPSGIRCRIDEGWVLTCYPRSSLGCKYRLWLDNLVGVIDSDYYNAQNEGHVFIQLTNNGEKLVEVNPGDKVIQGIFLPYGITYDDEAVDVRTGGLGSTGA